MYPKFIKLVVLFSRFVCCGFAGRVLYSRFLIVSYKGKIHATATSNNYNIIIYLSCVVYTCFVYFSTLI